MIKIKEWDIKYNLAIDFLRVIAMIFVFGIHFSQCVAFPGKTLFECGAGAVYIFFTLSGYLAFLSLDKNISNLDYWKKRCRRILPSYWLLLTLIILWKLFLNDIPADSYKIGFLRYYLGLQTVISSDQYDYWNNMYGLWTMSCFIVFYFLAPLLKKWISSLRQAVIFYWQVCFFVKSHSFLAGFYYKIDFMIQQGEQVVSIKVKAEENVKAKSLKAYADKYAPEKAVRVSMKSYKKEDWLVNIPLYAIRNL